MSIQESRTIVQGLFDAFNRNGVDSNWLFQATAACAPDCEVENVATGQSFQEVEQFLRGWTDAFPGARTTITSMVVEEDAAVVEFQGTGTNTGPLQGPVGPIPPTGKTIDVRFCQVHQISAGKVKHIRLYFDNATLIQQLGIG
jgi:predicted ester cyclase